MSISTKLRKFATPLTVGAFFLSAATGIAMFFEIDTEASKTLHEWLGWLLVTGVVLHVTINWKSFANYFRQPLALLIIGVLVGLTAFSFIPQGGGGRADGEEQGEGQRRGPPGRLATEVLMTAPLEVAAKLAKVDADVLSAKLKAAGLEVESSEETLAEIAEDGGKSPGEMMELVFR